MNQRPDSKLEDDAVRAAELWNKMNKTEESSTGDSESYETSVSHLMNDNFHWLGFRISTVRMVTVSIATS